MGGITDDRTVFEMVHKLNDRFSPGVPIREMATIQKEFGVFSESYSLKQTYRLLHLVPDDFNARKRWFIFLDHLKTYPSDQDGVNGHDRVVRARQENLECGEPLPIYTTTHLAADDDRVTVSRGRPVPHETQEYLVISMPTVPAAGYDRSSRIAARVRRIAESIGA